MQAQLKRGGLGLKRLGLIGILSSVILFIQVGCGGSEDIGFDPGLGKAETVGDYNVDVVQLDDNTTLSITSNVDDSFQATVTQLEGGDPRV